MKLIIGLGNPGPKYQNNRHNAGHMFIYFVEKKLPPQIKALKTSVFMNHSGQEVQKLVNFYKISLENLIIVHDDLDITLGKFKIEKGGGPKLHNGLESIEKSLSTKDFWRVRIGVDNREPEKRIDGETYVLQDFLAKEKDILLQTFADVVDKWENFFHNEVVK